MTYSIDTIASPNATLPGLIEQAAAALATATTAAEVLDAKSKAGFAYTTAKAAARFAEAKNAHDAIVAACHKAMGDALIIKQPPSAVSRTNTTPRKSEAKSQNKDNKIAQGITLPMGTISRPLLKSASLANRF